MTMMKGAAGAAKKSAKWGDDMRKESMRQHKCFWGGGDQGTLSLRACDSGGIGGGSAYKGDATWEGGKVQFKKGGLVTKGSKKEKSRLKGNFKVF